jgi:RNA polymerase sigma factor (sigma-70 family)
MTAGAGTPTTSELAQERTAAFVELYGREHANQVRRAALLVGDGEAAHDIVHDAFVEVYRRWSHIDDPGPYLGRTVLNGCRDHGRRIAMRRRKAPLLVQRGTDPADEPLWDAIQRLPFRQRAVVVLKFYGQLPEREIASLLDCPAGSVGPWLRRGLDTLRREFE